MPDRCFICREVLEDAPRKSFGSPVGAISVHDACFAAFQALLKEAMGESGRTMGKMLTSGFITEVDKNPVLVRRVWSTYSIPILAYLDYRGQPVAPSEVYKWLDLNEVKVSNPSQYVKELIKKGHLGVINKEGKRYIFITDIGRQYLLDSAEGDQ